MCQPFPVSFQIFTVQDAIIGIYISTDPQELCRVFFFFLGLVSLSVRVLVFVVISNLT